jgi:hypothetical protein
MKLRVGGTGIVISIYIVQHILAYTDRNNFKNKYNYIANVFAKFNSAWEGLNNHYVLIILREVLDWISLFQTSHSLYSLPE